jgi:oxygen-independent coproporphyrinogen-3 oxidase
MSFGLYIHIPYCLQKCHYCDFTTFDLNHEISMSQYTQLILTELRQHAKFIPNKNLNSIYFGGGTPSLLPAEDILTIRRELANLGFDFNPNLEMSIEINPGTIDDKKLDLYLAAGVNRFSVGVQTFNDEYLKKCGREHSANESRQTLNFLRKNKLNFSFDLLFGLPHQTTESLAEDLRELISFNPHHVSLYNLTVPKNHKMNAFRAPDAEQAEMFTTIDSALTGAGIFRYELSNFARPGFESRHNQIYWSDGAYWGVGISAHSYFPKKGPWGTRFWNSTSPKKYLADLESTRSAKNHFLERWSEHQVEELQLHEAMTDFCHTQLRMIRGLSLVIAERKFGKKASALISKRSEKLLESNMLLRTLDGFQLSPLAYPLANQVFLELTFLPNEL